METVRASLLKKLDVENIMELKLTFAFLAYFNYKSSFYPRMLVELRISDEYKDPPL